MRTAIYIRVSTQEQAKEGFSLAAQTQKLRAYCESQDWIVSDIYADEGFSAKDTERPQLQRLMKDITRKRFDVVLVWRLDRLTRSVLDLYELLKLLDEHQVGFKSSTEVFDTTTAMGRFFITMVAAMAQWERENIGERVTLGMAQKALEGKRVTARAPFGYTKQGDTLIINDREAEIVREIFEKYVSGYGIHRLTIWLQSTGTRDNWNSHTISYLLENPVYAGKIRWGYRTSKSGYRITKNPDDIIVTDGDHDPIIDLETWELAQSIRGSRKTTKRAGTGNFPFSGILFCSKCGISMAGHYGKKYTYYRCRNYSIKKCDAKMIRTDNLESWIISSLSEITEKSLGHRTPVVNEHSPKVRKRDIEKEREDIAARKKRLWDAYELGEIALDELGTRLERLRGEEMSLDAESAPADNGFDEDKWKKQTIELAHHIVSGWESFDVLMKKELIRNIIERIDADHETINIDFKQM